MQRRDYLFYVGRRVLIFLLTVWASFTLAFIFFRLVPGDPIQAFIKQMEQQYSYQMEASEDFVAMYEERFGLNGTLFEQYVRYLGNVILHFDFGPALIGGGQGQTYVNELVGRALPWTIGLMGLSTLIAWVLGIIFGGMLGWLRDTRFAQTFTMLSVVFSQIPQYIVALALLALFAFTLNVLPTRNAYPANATPAFTLEFFAGVLRHGLLPSLSIIIVAFAGWILSTRSLIVSILGEDYLLYAEAKGLSKRRIFLSYALRNAMLPQVTGLAISLGFIVNGTVLVETLFNYPGIGSLLSRAVGLLDYNTIQAIVLMSIFSVLAANLLLDLALPLVDPRVKTRG